MKPINNTSNLEVQIHDSRKDMGAAAAARFTREVDFLLSKKTHINVIFAAAPSQNEFLASLYHQNLPWHRINAFHMDEYIGLHVDAPQGFGNFLKDKLFSKISFNSVFYLNGNAENLDEECKRYSGLLDQFPTDIVCMGIGENGHLAFNDPPVANFEDLQVVKVVELDEVCRQQQVNDGCFEKMEQVPTHALTLTIPTLMKSSFINCVVPGTTKAEAVYKTLYADIHTENPSTILRIHPHSVIFLDRESSAKILT